MGRSKKKSHKKREAPKTTVKSWWCWYCERQFDNEKTLIQHQRAKHFKCMRCYKKFSHTGALIVHLMQVHKQTLQRVPNSIEGRDNPDITIVGMDGIPDEDYDDFMLRHDPNYQPKKLKTNTTIPSVGLPVTNIPTTITALPPTEQTIINGNTPYTPYQQQQPNFHTANPAITQSTPTTYPIMNNNLLIRNNPQLQNIPSYNNIPQYQTTQPERTTPQYQQFQGNNVVYPNYPPQYPSFQNQPQNQLNSNINSPQNYPPPQNFPQQRIPNSFQPQTPPNTPQQLLQRQNQPYPPPNQPSQKPPFIFPQINPNSQPNNSLDKPPTVLESAQNTQYSSNPQIQHPTREVFIFRNDEFSMEELRSSLSKYLPRSKNN
ncbi:zinc finger protein [Anaeramoeba ignava]|uniref:Zinc finger protein n=1 Tax=Anaeramoeba ignava TaxID=1746090 RepID=A0A9Q0LD93_ANAIG|nr:zinc finger protein [Anaeramoeba ignava]